MTANDTDDRGEPLTEKQEDSLTGLVWSSWLNAVLYRSTATIGGESLREVIEWCSDSAEGILTCGEQEVADELAHVALDFEATRVRSAQAWITDLVYQSLEAPLLEPTPNPTAPEVIEQKVLARLKNQLMAAGFDGDLKTLAEKIKAETTATEFSEIKKAVKRCETEIRDRLVEADFRSTASEFIRDFVVYPFACLKAPVWSVERVPGWSGDTFTMREKLTMGFERVNPRDILWSPNARNIETAAYLIERRWLTRAQLLRIPGVFREELLEAMEGLMSDYDWLSQHPERTPQPLTSDATPVGVLEFHGAVSGRELKRFGFTQFDDWDFHEAIILMVNHRIIHLRLAQHNSPVTRPYSVACFEELPDTVYGIGVVQRCKKVAKVARAFLYAGLRNAAASALPVGEVDYQRIAEFLPKEDLGRLMVGTVVPVAPDHSGGGRPAHYFTSIPNQTAAFLNAMQVFMTLLDSASGIPAIAGGDFSSSGQSLGRSFRGLALAVSSASKNIKLPLYNLDRAIEQIVRRVYWYIQANSKDSSLKADANVIARGTSGFIQKEASAAAANESLLQALQIAQTGMLPPDMLKDMVRAAFADSIPDIDRYFPDSQVQAIAQQGIGDTAQAPGFGGQTVKV
jgi:hypothetical protein